MKLTRSQKLFQEVLTHYGSCCSNCGDHRPEVLTLDHSKGDGMKDRLKTFGATAKTVAGYRAGSPYYAKLKRAGWPKNKGLRILCWNCNGASKYRGGLPPLREMSCRGPY